MFLFKSVQPRGTKIWISSPNSSQHINNNMQKQT